MSSVKHIMFLSKNVKTPLLLEVKVGFVYGLRLPMRQPKAPFEAVLFLFLDKVFTVRLLNPLFKFIF